MAPSRSPQPDDGLAELTVKYRDRLTIQNLDWLAASLGLSAESLHRLRVGWTWRAWSFPMTDAAGRVRGIRLRYPDGSKCAVKGGREGLFIPEGLEFESALLIAEGATDTAALLDLGFNAVGRPNCNGGRGILSEFVTIQQTREAVIVADADAQGRAGARSLAAMLAVRVRSVRVIVPPEGIKDARAWKIAGATHDDVQRVIDDAEALRPSVEVRRAGR
jgi:phage/plasmid primase-like uncharacterized protein